MAASEYEYMGGEQYLEEILRQAIRFEDESYNLYTNALEITQVADAKAMLGELAQQELGHKEKLQRLQEEGVTDLAPVVRTSEAQDLKLSDYLKIPAELDEEADLQDVLLLAIKREASTREFYVKLAELTDEGQAKTLFDFLAEEELQHKNRVEAFYDKLVYQDF